MDFSKTTKEAIESELLKVEGTGLAGIIRENLKRLSKTTDPIDAEITKKVLRYDVDRAGFAANQNLPYLKSLLLINSENHPEYN